jgi:hypothetical protein
VKKKPLYRGLEHVNALFVAFLLSSTALLSVCFGVLGAYYLLSGLLALFNPARPSLLLRALEPNQSHASGD